MIKAIAHLGFHVKDMEKSLHFYCDILGFEDAFEMKDDNGKPWIRYLKINNGQFIELFYSEGRTPAHSSYDHLCLEVEDLYATAEILRQNGVVLDVKPTQGKDLNMQCWAKDPDGNRIEFMQIDPNSPQAKSCR